MMYTEELPMKRFKILDSERKYTIALLSQMDKLFEDESMQEYMGGLAEDIFSSDAMRKDYQSFIVITLYGAYMLLVSHSDLKDVKYIHNYFVSRIEIDEEYIMSCLIGHALGYYISIDRDAGFYNERYVDYFKRALIFYSFSELTLLDMTREEYIMMNMYSVIGGYLKDTGKDIISVYKHQDIPKMLDGLNPRSDTYFKSISEMSHMIDAKEWYFMRTLWAVCEYEGVSDHDSFNQAVDIAKDLTHKPAWYFITRGDKFKEDTCDIAVLALLLAILFESKDNLSMKEVSDMLDYIDKNNIKLDKPEDISDVIDSCTIGNKFMRSLIKDISDGGMPDIVSKTFESTDFNYMIDVAEHLVPDDLSKFHSLWEVKDMTYKIGVTIPRDFEG